MNNIDVPPNSLKGELPLTEPTALGGAVREARMRTGVSLRSLAARISVSPATLSHVETGKTQLSVQRLRTIASALGVSVEEILRGVDGEQRDSINIARVVPSSSTAASMSRSEDDWRVFPPLPFDRVLRAAVQVFVSKGYHGASIRDVARECGMSVPGIYHHQQSKQAMLWQILDMSVDDLLDHSRRASAEGTTSVERFSLMVESLVLFHTYRPKVGFIGASEMRSLEEPFRESFVKRRVEQQRLIDHEVEAAVAEGHFHVDQPLHAARAVVTMCTATAQWYNPAGPATPPVIAAEYVHLALNLMGYRP